VRIKTKFQKKAGFENVRMEKENGEWKVADYSIEMNI
jgi:ribosomal silencing factor RsfS